MVIILIMVIFLYWYFFNNGKNFNNGSNVKNGKFNNNGICLKSKIVRRNNGKIQNIFLIYNGKFGL